MVARSILLVLFFQLSAPLLTYADFYRYYDESGGVNVTNEYSSVPERYRASIMVVKDTDLEKKSRERDKRTRAEQVNLERQRRRSGTAKQAQPSPAVSSAAMQPDEKTEAGPAKIPATIKPGWFARQLPLLKVMALISLCIAFAVVAGKLISPLLPRTLGTIVRIALFAGVIVYVFNAYSDRVAKAFVILKSETDVVQKAVDKRSERIDKQSEAQ